MAGTIGDTIRSVKGFVDEVVVIDMMSSDETVKVAEKTGAKVYEYKEDLGFADPARNFALGKATKDWVLVLDADEEASPDLVTLLKKIVSQDVPQELVGECYFIPRQNIIFGQAIQHTGWWPDYQLRFFKKGTVQWTDKVHTHPEATGEVIHLPADSKTAIIHHNYQTVSQFIDRLNTYTELEVQKKQSETKREIPFTAAQLINSFSSDLFRRLFVEEGLKDGLHGLSLAFLQSFYELSVFLKQWQTKDFVDQKNASHERQVILALEDFHKDLHYWISDWHVKNSSGIAKLYWTIKRKQASS